MGLVQLVIAGLALACTPAALADSGNGTDAAPAGMQAEQEEPALGPSETSDREDSGAPPTEEDNNGGAGSGRNGNTTAAADWPKCDFKSGNTSHTLVGIMNERFIIKFGESAFTPILQRVDARTNAILNEFDTDKPGHTLMVPLNQATNFSDPQLNRDPILSIYSIDPTFISTENATAIVRAHLIPETLTYYELEQLTREGTNAKFTALDGTIWEFTYYIPPDSFSGSVVLVDSYNITQGASDGILFIQSDISNSKQGECPNTVFTVDGLVATPEVTAPPEPEMGPVIAPEVAPAPLAPRAVVSATTNFTNPSNPFAAPPSSQAAGPRSLTDPDREEALRDNQSSGSVGVHDVHVGNLLLLLAVLLATAWVA